MAKPGAKLVAFYKEPANRDEFDQKYFETHVPLADKIPGLRAMEVVKFQKSLLGGDPPYYMMATLTFDDMEALQTGLGSTEGKAAGANIMGFAGGVVTLVSAETAVTQGLTV